MKLIDRFVNGYKEAKRYINAPKKANIFLTSLDLEVRIYSKLNEYELEEFNHYWKTYIGSTIELDNEKIKYKKLIDNTFTVETARKYCESLKEYFQQRNYYVNIVDLTFLKKLL